MRIVPTPEFLRGVYSVAGFHQAPALEPTAQAGVLGNSHRPEDAVSPGRIKTAGIQQLDAVVPDSCTKPCPATTRSLNMLMMCVLPPAGYCGHCWEMDPMWKAGEKYAVREDREADDAGSMPIMIRAFVSDGRENTPCASSSLNAELLRRSGCKAGDMTDEEALSLMETKAFQTEAEQKRQGKLRRAKLTAGQLITYYVGYHQWIAMRERLQQKQGNGFLPQALQRRSARRGPRFPFSLLLEPLAVSEKLGVH